MAFPTQPSRFTRADGSPIRVLVVEDEPSLTGLLSMAMRYEGWDVTTANSGAHAVHEAQATRPDVIVLDMRLSDFDGLEVMRQIRINQPTVRAVFLTAKDAASGRIAGLTAGGDDYITKPFSVRELVARVGAVMRRPRTTVSAPEPERVCGDLVIDLAAHEARVSGQVVQLTRTEFDLLAALSGRPHQAFSRRQLIDIVWDPAWVGDERLVDVHIKNLRRKLDADPARYIDTVRGVGYRMAEQ